MGNLTSENDTFVERRKRSSCHIPIKTQRFLKYWPLMVAVTYSSVALWPATVFGDGTDTFYSSLASVIVVLGVLSTVFWRNIFLRSILVSVALARSASIIALALVAEPPIPFPAIMRLAGAGVLASIFFCLAIVETPFLKVMRNGY